MSDLAARPKLVVYTVLVGEKEALNDPLLSIGWGAGTDLDVEFVCFTDRTDLASPTWQFRPFELPLIPPEKASRQPKAMPDMFFPGHEYSLYIDNTVVFKRMPMQADLDGVRFRAFRHPWRSHPRDEADIVVRSGLDEAGVVARQVAQYEQLPAYEGIRTLTAGTVLLRRHAAPEVKRFGQMWWEQILLFSKRDQLSLDLCAQLAGCSPEHFPGDKTSNDLFFWPVIAGGIRVQGSFDAGRYAWEHRLDPEARQNPRRHFLNHAAASAGERYSRRVDRLAYACERTGSSLAEGAAPRRSLAGVIEPLLAGLEAPSASVLVVGVSSSEELGVEVEELRAAAEALRQYYRFTQAPDVVTAQVSESDLRDPAPFQAAAGKSGFSLVLVLGVPNSLYAGALAKFKPLLGASAKLLLAFTGSLNVAQMSAMYAAVGMQGSLNVFHSRHVMRAGPIPGSVFVLSA